MRPAYPPEFRYKVMDALRAAPMSLQAIASEFGISHQTVLRWSVDAKVELPSAEQRMRFGSIEGGERRWPGVTKRRRTAAIMRANAATLKEIAAATNLTVSGAHYAAEGPKEGYVPGNWDEKKRRRNRSASPTRNKSTGKV